MVSEANEPGSESGKRSDDRRGAARGTRAGCWSSQEGGAGTHLAARLPPRSPGSFAAAAMDYPDGLLVRARPGFAQLDHVAVGIADPELRAAEVEVRDAARVEHLPHPFDALHPQREV